MSAADMETCSLCLGEVLFSSLLEVDNDNPVIYQGALICIACRREHPDIMTRRL